jgi:MFS family permease
MFFHFVRGKEQPKPEMTTLSYRSIATNKSFILYFVPWCMFTLINYMTIPIQQNIFETQASYQFFTAMENVVIALSAVLSGFIADKFGRKRLTIIGFIMLGIGYAMMGLFSASASNVIWGNIIYIIADGIAWGIFYVLFVFTLWGDLAHTKASDKLYFLGALPFVTSYFMQMLLADSLQGIDKTLIFSFASFFLFLAVLPLFYAPETLSEKLLKDRDLQSYVLNAKKKVAKENGKADKKRKSAEDDQTIQTEATENDASYEEAKKLAEKYY